MAAYTTIDDAGSFFNTNLYVGDEASHAITGVGFQPDMVWLKDRDYAYNQIITDAVRGATKNIYPNGDYAEDTDAQGVKSFDTDGFTVGTTQSYNKTGDDFVSWNWKAGTTSGITTDGSTTITPSAYSFNATSGCAILLYTGTGSTAKLAHGLGVAPGFWTTKSIDTTGKNWLTYSYGGDAATPADIALYLNNTDSQASSSTYWGGTMPDSVNLTLGTNANCNTSSEEYIMYCFAPVQGFSKFGNYEGNGNADGPFIYTGFRPAYLLVKDTSTTSDWFIWDDQRLGYNVKNNQLTANTDVVEATSDMIDILSTGFKPRVSIDPNGAGTWVYAAFARSPFVNSNGVPTNAR